MQTYHSLSELKQLNNDPALHREIYGFASFCIAEILEYGGEDDLADHELNIVILTKSDHDYLKALGQPEETATITLRIDNHQRTFHRCVYASEIVFWEDSI